MVEGACYFRDPQNPLKVYLKLLSGRVIVKQMFGNDIEISSQINEPWNKIINTALNQCTLALTLTIINDNTHDFIALLYHNVVYCYIKYAQQSFY